MVNYGINYGFKLWLLGQYLMAFANPYINKGAKN